MEGAFGGPISLEQLVNRPDAISTVFSDEEEAGRIKHHMAVLEIIDTNPQIHGGHRGTDFDSVLGDCNNLRAE